MMFISFGVALLCGVAMVNDTTPPWLGIAPDVIFGISVAVFVGSFIGIVARAVLKSLARSDHNPDEDPSRVRRITK